MTRSDDFDTDALAAHWVFAGGESTSAAVGETGDDHVLQLVTPDGDYDLWGAERGAARVMQAAQDEDLALTVRFLSAPSQKFQMQGFIVEGEGDTWLRVDTYWDGSRLRVFAAGTTDDASTSLLAQTVPGGVAPYLALERVGDVWTVRYSVDGASWTTAGSFEFAMAVTDVGLFAGNTGASTGFTAEVDWFEVASDPLTEEDGGPLNAAPVAADDAFEVPADGLTIAAADLLSNDTDPDGDGLTFAGFQPPANGTLTDNGDGTLTYTPDQGFAGTDTFTYAVSDGQAEATATVTLTVTAPDEGGDEGEGEGEGGTGGGGTLVSDDFADGVLDSSWSFAGGSGTSASGATVGDDGVLRIATPDGTYDLWGANTDAGRLTQSAADEDFALTVRFLSAPSQKFQMQGFIVEGEGDTWLRVDTYWDGSRLRVFAAGTTDDASTSLLAQTVPGGVAPYLALERVGDVWTVRYSVDGASWTTAGSFEFAMAVTDVGLFAGNTGASTGFTAEVDWFEVASDPLTEEDGGPLNAAPVAADDAFEVPADGLTIAAADLLSNDTDPDGDGLTFAGFQPPANGTLTDNGDGTLTYTPDQGFAGTDTFTYAVSDGQAEATANVTLTVTAPDEGGGEGEGEGEGGTGGGGTLVSDDFADGVLDSSWSFAGGSGTSASGATVGDDGVLRIATPDGTYDLWGANTDAGRLTQSAADEDFALTVRFLSAPSQKFQMQGFVVEGEGDTWLRVDTYWDGSRLRVFAAGTTDDASTSLLSQTVPGGVAPYLALERVGDVWTVRYSVDGASWTTAGSFEFAMAVTDVGLFAGNTGASTGFTAEVDWFEVASDPLTEEDGGPLNAAPVAADDAFAVPADGLTIAAADLLSNDTDPDGNGLTFAGFQPPANGTLTDNGDGTLTYIPDQGFAGTDTFTYAVSDGQAEATATVTLTVTASLPFEGDDFSGATLDPMWTIGGAAGTSAGLETQGAQLVLRLEASGDNRLWASNTAAQVTQSVTGPFDVAAGFLSTPTTPGDGHGLIARADDGSFIALGVEATGAGDQLVVIANIDGTPEMLHAGPIDLADARLLRLARDGDAWVAYASPDGVTWDAVAAFDSPLAVTSLGLYAIGRDGYTAEVDYVMDVGEPLVIEDGAPLNTPPVAGDDSLATPLDTPLNIAAADLLANDGDGDGDALSFLSYDQPAHGTLVDDGAGNLTYTPQAGYSGADSFTYRVGDGTDVATGTVTINVASDASGMFSDDFRGEAIADGWTFYGPVGSAVLGQDGDEHFVEIASPPDIAVDALRNLTSPRLMQPLADVDFEISAGFLNEPLQPYQEHGFVIVQDESTWIRYDIAMTSSGLRLIVGLVEGEEYDIALFKGLDPGEATALRVRRIDSQYIFESSADGETWTQRLAVTSDIVPTSAGIFAGSTTYNGSVPGFTSRVDWFEVSDDPLTTEDNDAPVAALDVLATAQDAPLLIDVADLIANDSDPDGDPISLAGFEAPDSGTLVDNGDGTLTFTPDPGMIGAVHFATRISDGDREATAAAVIGVSAAGNTGPAALDDTAATGENTDVLIDVLANDTDTDGDTLNIEAVGAAGHGVVTITAGGELLYTPDAGFTGTDSFDVVVHDGRGGLATSRVEVEVTAADGPPVAVNDAVSVAAGESVVLTGQSLLANDSDPNGDTLSIVQIGTPLHGSLVDNGDGTYTYTPPANYHGRDSLTYTVSDGTNEDTATVVIDVLAPIKFVSDDFSGSVADAEWRLEGPAGTATLNQVQGEGFLRLGVPSNSYDPWGDNSALRYMQDIADIDFAIEASFLSAPDTRTQMQGLLIEQDADNWLRFDVLYDGSELRLFAAQTLNGVSKAKIDKTIEPGDATFLRVVRDGETYTLQYSADGTDWSTGGSFDSAIAARSAGVFAGTAHQANQFNVDVDYVRIVGQPFDDDATVPFAPEAVDDTLHALVGEPLHFDASDLLANDIDLDGDALTIVAIEVGGKGSLTDHGDGTYTYVSQSSGVGRITYEISDGTGTPTSTGTAWVDVENGAPVADADPVAMEEDGVLVLAPLANDVDPDGDTLEIVDVGTPQFGTLELVGQELHYTPFADAWGEETLSYTVSDGLAEATATITITVEPRQDAPVATDDRFLTPAGTPLTLALADLLANDVDVDGDILSVTQLGTPSAGTLIDNGDGTITFEPGPDFEGLATFEYTVSDGIDDAVGLVEIAVREPIDVWSGSTQSFGSLGTPQKWINILGNVETAGLASLSYTLNGGPSRELSVGPDTRRLHDNGDFNADIAFDELDPTAADDLVTIRAEYDDGSVYTSDVTVEYEAGTPWPTTYSIDWENVDRVEDVVQIADGEWAIEPDGSGVRPTSLGYDRLLVLGDETWDNYELNLTITTHDLENVDPNGRDGGGFAIGMLWGGHTDSPKAGWQPASGWEPGAAIFYNGNFKVHSYDDFNTLLDVEGYPLDEGATYEVRARVEQVGLYDRLYSLKIWEVGTPEPGEWTVQGVETFSLDEAPAVGSIYLNAHYYDVAFNDLSVTPIEGSDITVGTDGDDLLVAVDTSALLPGLDEVDVFTGGEGADTFIFGQDGVVFYDDGDPNTAGETDFAFVWDFEPGTDSVQLVGAPSDYVITEAPASGPEGTAIYRTADDETDELIAILNAPSPPQQGDFIYVDGLFA